MFFICRTFNIIRRIWILIAIVNVLKHAASVLKESIGMALGRIDRNFTLRKRNENYYGKILYYVKFNYRSFRIRIIHINSYPFTTFFVFTRQNSHSINTCACTWKYNVIRIRFVSKTFKGPSSRGVCFCS